MTLNSINLRYTDAGQGLPLVFVHGFPFSRGVWQKQIDALRSSHRVISLLFEQPDEFNHVLTDWLNRADVLKTARSPAGNTTKESS